jgi:hypothetical protein
MDLRDDVNDSFGVGFFVVIPLLLLLCLGVLVACRIDSLSAVVVAIFLGSIR